MRERRLSISTFIDDSSDPPASTSHGARNGSRTVGTTSSRWHPREQHWWRIKRRSRPLLPQASGGAFGNNTGGGPSVGAVPLLPQASGGGGAGNNTGGGSGTEEEPSAPLGSLLKRMGCLNCGQTGHTKEQCTQGCRKCGSNGHKVEGCVSRNVCPCADWPGHVRWNCHLACLHCKDKRNL